MRNAVLLLVLTGCETLACWDVDGNRTDGECACPTVADDSAVALESVNAARAAAGLAPVVRVPELDAAAQGHIDYLLANDPELLGRSAHTQVAGEAGFTGADHFTRATAAGWTGTRLYEDISRSGDAERAVFSWMRTVYHRLPILVPEVTGMGFASVCSENGRYDVALFAENGPVASVGPIVWPADGDDFVPGTWSGLELPDPLPDVDDDVGYPITVQFARDTGTVTAFSLTDASGAAVAVRTLTPATDPASALDDEFAAIPLAPLAFEATYTASATVQQAGAEQVVTWTFTTRNEAQTPR